MDKLVIYSKEDNFEDVILQFKNHSGFRVEVSKEHTMAFERSTHRPIVCFKEVSKIISPRTIYRYSDLYITDKAYERIDKFILEGLVLPMQCDYVLDIITGTFSKENIKLKRL